MEFNPKFANRVGMSVDISLEESTLEKMKSSVQQWCPGAIDEPISIRSLGIQDYLRISRSFDVIIVFFAGYNIERYGPNLWKHLCLFPGSIYGVNIEGHIFKIPRVQATVLISTEFIVKGISQILGRLYAMVMPW